MSQLASFLIKPMLFILGMVSENIAVMLSLLVTVCPRLGQYFKRVCGVGVVEVGRREGGGKIPASQFSALTYSRNLLRPTNTR